MKINLIKMIFFCAFVILIASNTYAQSSDQEVAGMRADLMAVADAIELTGQDKAAADLRAALEAMTDEELYLSYGDTDIAALTEAFTNTATAIDAVLARGYSQTDESISIRVGRSAGLPNAAGDYPGLICPDSPGGRSDANTFILAVDAIAIANIALDVAKGIWFISDRACGTVAVAIGVIGNPQNAVCLIADVIIIAADAAVGITQGIADHIASCDASVDSAEIKGVYERADHIHTDLTTHDANIDGDLAAHDANIDGDMAAHDTNIDGDLAAHDANIDGDLAAHDANIDGDLIAHDANLVAHDANLVAHDANIDGDLVLHDANIDGDLVVHNANLIAHDANIDADLILHDSDIKALLANLQGAVNENQRLIKITMSRQQEILRLLMTPSGSRNINEDVLTCTGDDCPIYPALQLCQNGSLSWNCN